MRISSKGRFAVTAMISLALSEKNGPTTLAALSEEQGLSLSYLEQFFARLRNQGLVEGVRGPGGGYRLAKSAGEISMAEIITAADDKNTLTRAENIVEIYENRQRATDQMWNLLCKRLYEFLDNITLADMMAEYKEGTDSSGAKNGEIAA